MNIKDVGKVVESMLNDLSTYFIPNAELTFIMRIPGESDSHLIVSNDNLDEVGELLKKQHRGDAAHGQVKV